MKGVLLAVAAALVVVAPASAARFSVGVFDTSPGASGKVRLTLRTDGAARVVTYAPAGWAANLGLAPGTLVATDAGAAMVAADPSAHTADACAPGRHAAVWVYGDAVPFFVDPWSGPGAYRIAVCLSAASTLHLEFEPTVFANPASTGLYTWRTIVTPPSGDAYELQSQVPIPHLLTVALRRGRVSGALSFEGLPEQGAHVQIYTVHGRLLGSATTRGNGGYSLRSRRLRGVRRVVARTTERPAACASPTVPRCTAHVAPAFATSAGA